MERWIFRFLKCSVQYDSVVRTDQRGNWAFLFGISSPPVDATAARPLCRHGNPNVLTHDIGTSSLAQGCTGQITVVQVRKYTDFAPAVRAFLPPSGMVFESKPGINVRINVGD